ncbi:hypothetical protein BO71DRAFT_404626, partial [Aspergillus ellipticus CBS 707.79]
MYKSKLKGGENCPKDYPNNIEGCFGLIILDKAHNLRNKTSGISQAVYDFIRYSRLLLKRRSIPEVMGPAAVKEALTASSVRFRALLKCLIIRRTLASAIPFKSGRIISKNIPPA